MIRVLLVDDHTVFVETLSAALQSDPQITIVGVATSATEGLKVFKVARPDVTLLDLALPDFDGIELARQLRELDPSAKILILTGSTESTLFARAMGVGVRGYLIKESSLSEVTDAVHRAQAGQMVIPERSVGAFLNADSPEAAKKAMLTERELEVLALLGTGTDLKTIARVMGIKWHTVRSYVKNILAKLDVHTQLEAVTRANELGILRERKSE